MRRDRILFALILAFFLYHAPPAPAAAPTADLRQKLDALEKTSSGSSQEREIQKEIIGLVRKMKAAPPVSGDVRRHMARGEAFVEEAKDKSGFDLAIREFQDAARKAPWLAAAHYNLGVVQEKAGSYDAAMESFKMYLLADPQAKDAEEVQKRIYKIEARKEAASAQAAEKRRQEQARLAPPKPPAPDLNGLWRVRGLSNVGQRPTPRSPHWGREESRKVRVDVRGRTFRAEVSTGSLAVFQGSLSGGTIRGTVTIRPNWLPFMRNLPSCPGSYNLPFEGEVHDGGRTILLVARGGYGGGPKGCSFKPNYYFNSYLLSR